MAMIRRRIFLKSGRMMRSYKRHQGSSFMFELRHLLSKSWVFNNIKYTQDWPRGQSNKSSTSSGVMGVIERRDRRSSAEFDKTDRSPTDRPLCPRVARCSRSEACCSASSRVCYPFLALRLI